MEFYEILNFIVYLDLSLRLLLLDENTAKAKNNIIAIAKQFTEGIGYTIPNHCGSCK